MDMPDQEVDYHIKAAKPHGNQSQTMPKPGVQNSTRDPAKVTDGM